MKKFASLLIALVMVVAVFASCQNPGKTDDGKGTTVPKQTDDKTTTAAPATDPAPATSEIVTDEATEPVEEGLPKVRTIYSTDTRSLLELLDHGVDGKVVNNLTQGKGVIVNATIDGDGKVEAAIAEWDVINTSTSQYTNDGKNKYLPFIGFTKELTVNEFILGDVTHWRGEGNYTLFTNYSKLEIWYTDNPNGTWTKWDCTCEPFENPDNGILWGTYAQGLSFKGADVTARYFLMYDPDPQENELWFVSNVAGPAVIYNPPAA